MAAWRTSGVVLLALTAGLVGGCASTTNSQNPAPSSSSDSSSSGQPGPSSGQAVAPRLVRYQASSYSARRPADWTTAADEASHSSYTESKWSDPSDSRTFVLIDMSPGDTTDPAAKAAAVRQAATVDQTIFFGPVNLHAQSGWKWVFKKGRDKRADYFLSACGASFAVLGSTEPRNFLSLSRTFKKVAGSIQCTGSVGSSPSNPPPSTTSSPQASAPSNPAPGASCGQPDNNSPPCDPSNPPPDFCSTHQCIPNFPNGRGTVVQCNDGDWSQSGGLSGACSDHGGESANP